MIHADVCIRARPKSRFFELESAVFSNKQLTDFLEMAQGERLLRLPVRLTMSTSNYGCGFPSGLSLCLEGAREIVPWLLRRPLQSPLDF